MNLIELLNQLALSGGDWVVYLLLLTSVASVYVMAERYIYFSIVSKSGAELRRALMDALEKGDVEGAQRELKRFHGPEARILALGLSAAGRGAANARERMESQLIKEKAAMEANLAVLATVGS